MVARPINIAAASAPRPPSAGPVKKSYQKVPGHSGAPFSRKSSASGAIAANSDSRASFRGVPRVDRDQGRAVPGGLVGELPADLTECGVEDGPVQVLDGHNRVASGEMFGDLVQRSRPLFRRLLDECNRIEPSRTESRERPFFLKRG